jgi:hypothetical protein
MSAQRYEEEQSTIILEGKYTIPKMLTYISDSEESQDEMSLGQLLDMKSNSDLSHLNVMAKAPIVRTRTDGAIKLADKCKLL